MGRKRVSSERPTGTASFSQRSCRNPHSAIFRKLMYKAMNLHRVVGFFWGSACARILCPRLAGIARDCMLLGNATHANCRSGPYGG